MNFLSDTISGVHPQIMKAINLIADSYGGCYGNDNITINLEKKFSEIFEKEVKIFPVTGGTVGNCLALSSMIQKPYGKILCHERAHINVHECGAPEFFTNGCSPRLISGENCKIDPKELTSVMNQIEQNDVHEAPCVALSITQPTETGTIYSIDEVKTLSKIAKENNLPFYMDGARFANAVSALKCSPAEITWKAGIDAITLGATKNGAMMAEIVIFFNHDLINDFLFAQKRSGHLLSKLRFVSAQLDAYTDNNLWLKLSDHSNKMAETLTKELKKFKEIKFAYPPQTNQIFLILDEELTKYLEDNDTKFYRFPSSEKTMIRLVTNYQTSETEIYNFINLVGKYYKGK